MICSELKKKSNGYRNRKGYLDLLVSFMYILMTCLDSNEMEGTLVLI